MCFLFLFLLALYLLLIAVVAGCLAIYQYTISVCCRLFLFAWHFFDFGGCWTLFTSAPLYDHTIVLPRPCILLFEEGYQRTVMASNCCAILLLYQYAIVPFHCCYALNSSFVPVAFLVSALLPSQNLKTMICPDVLGYTQKHWDLAVLWRSPRPKTYRNSP